MAFRQMGGFFVVPLRVSLPYQWGEALGEAQKGDEAYEEDGIGEGNSGKLGRADVPDHYVVRQLHHHLPRLGYHHREGYFEISFIERKIFLQ